MEVILLERIGRLGKMGDMVNVKNGYARNFLLPRGKALRANENNKKQFEAQRAEHEERNEKAKQEAGKVGDKLKGKTFVAIRQAGETGQLYGSVSTRDIAELISEGSSVTIERSVVRLNVPIKSIGLHKVILHLHGEVDIDVTINVARTADEAKRQAKGEDLTKRRSDEDEEKAQAKIDAEAVFENALVAEGRENNATVA